MQIRRKASWVNDAVLWRCSFHHTGGTMFRTKRFRAVMAYSIVISMVMFNFQNCAPATRFSEGGVIEAASVGSINLDIPVDDCSFDGKPVASGQFVEAYQNSSVPFGQVCVPESRQCVNGVLSGSYKYPSCDIAAPVACRFNGQTIAHGESVIGFQSSSVPFGQTCVSEERVCNNGELSGTGQFSSCGVGIAASCLFGDRTIAHGENVIAYQSAIAEIGKSCQPETRACNNGNLSGSFLSNSCVARVASSKVVPVVESSTYTPFKLLLVIDDSYTMTQSQAKIAANIDSLLLPLKGKDVEVKIISTSQYNNVGSSYVEEYKTSGGQIASGTQSSGSSAAYKNQAYSDYKKAYKVQLQDANYSSIEKYNGRKVQVPLVVKDYSALGLEKYNGGAKGEELTNVGIEDKDFTNFSNRIKQKISSVGVGGSDQEQVMCPILQQIMLDNQNSFLKQGDKVGVVVLTDENDSSLNQNCYRSYTEIYKDEKPTSNGITYSVSYKYSVTEIRAYFSYDIAENMPAEYKDGILVKAAYKTTKNVSVSGDLTKYKLSTEAECVAKATESYSSPYYTNFKVSRCEFKTFERAQYDSKVSSDQCPAIANMTGFVSGSCVRTQYNAPHTLSYSTGTFSRSIDRVEHDVFFPEITGTFEQSVIDKMNDFFNGQFFVSVIHHTGEHALKAGQSVGAKLNALAANNPKQVSIHSIGSASYAPALEKLGLFANRVAVKKYNLSMPESAQVAEVVLVREGVETVLDQSKYQMVGSDIEMKMDLLTGDQIKINYSYLAQ